MLYDLTKRLARRVIGRNEVADKTPSVHTLVVGPYNIAEALVLPRRHYEFLRIDVSANCNLFCTYCEIGRSKGMLDPNQLREFLVKNVASVKNVMFGCAMEPTINKDLASYIQIARELVDPQGYLGIQSNGTLLHRHDYSRFLGAGLNTFSLSLDSMRPESMLKLRDGTDLKKVLENLDALRAAIPGLSVLLSVVITTGNIDQVHEVVEYAIQSGVKEVWLRQLTFQYEAVTPERAALVISDADFERLKVRLEPYRSKIPMWFLDSKQLMDTDQSYAEAIATPEPATAS